MNKIDSIKRKIKYRSEYRGIKEMDLLLSAFVKKYIDKLTYDELCDLYKLLEKDDDDIFKWYSGINVQTIKKNKITDLLKSFKLNTGGGGGIRTHE
tara:strand:+ start:3795 stop:4082 length:288 start_codon:yes stop_codon:yes gene_type:complete